MPDRPDDRVKPIPGKEELEPRLFLVVKDTRFPRPGLDTWFASIDEKASTRGSDKGTDPKACSCDSVGGSYCSCNKVCDCVPACGCVGHSSCSCVGHTSSGGSSYGGGGCRCAPVH